MNKSIEIKPSDNVSKKNQWLDHCRQNNIPYVIVDSRGHTAKVEWDYISYPMGVEKLFAQKDACLKAELKKIYDKYSTKSSTFSISSSAASISGLSIEHARAAADDVFDLIDNLINGKIC